MQSLLLKNLPNPIRFRNKTLVALIGWIGLATLLTPGSLAAWQESSTRTFRSPVVALEVDVERKVIFASSGNSVHIFDFSLEPLRKVVTEIDLICDFFRKEDRLFVAGGSPAEHGMIEVYSTSGSANNLRLLKRKLVHDDVIHSITGIKDDVVTASADSQVFVLSGRELKRKKIYAQHSKRVTVAEPIYGTERIISGGLDDTLRVWSLQENETAKVLTHHQDDILDIESFVPAEDDSRFFIPKVVSVSRDRTVRFWQPTIGRLVRFKRFEAVPTVCCWKTGTDNVLVGFANGEVVELSSQTLETKKLLDVGERVFSLNLLGDSTLLVGSRTRLSLKKLR